MTSALALIIGLSACQKSLGPNLVLEKILPILKHYNMTKNISRRNFLHKSALATTGAIVAGSPLLAKIPAPQRRKKKASATDKLNIAVIGIGGRGGKALDQLASENIVALCHQGNII